MAATRSTQTRRAKRRSDMLRAMTAVYEGHSDEERAGVQLDRLVEWAGIARSTFYVYFPDKVEYYSALTEHVFDELTAAGAYWWALTEEPTPSHVREALERLVDTFRSRRSTVNAILDAAASHTPIQARLRVAIGRFVAELAEHLRAGQANGTVDPSIDPETTATWLAWMLERGMTGLIGPADADHTDRLVRALAQIVWNVAYRAAHPAP